jgi:hypothetical protein
MRHSKLDLTMNVYTDPALLDVRGALDVLPSLPLTRQTREAAQATDDRAESLHWFALGRCKPVQTESFAVQ